VATISANASGGTPPYTYHWDSGLGTGQVKNVNPGSDSFYSVYVEDANGCTSSSVTVKVQYHPPLSVDALSDDSICPGETSSLAAIGSGGSGKGYTYTWSNGDNGMNTDVSPGTHTTYTVRLEDHCETPAVKDSVRIGLYQVPEVEIGGRDLEDCAPVEATLINETPEGMVGTECIWDLGDGVERPGCDSVHKKYTEPGCYDIGLTVRSPEGCVDSSSVKDFVCVRPYPEALFDYEPEETTVQDPVLKFRNLSTGSRHYAWSFGELDSSFQEHPRYSFPADSAGEYRVCMEASNKYGCKDTACSVVSLGGEVIVYVPNAFTPDGDGVNDRFGPVVQGVDKSDYHFYIYDRWGEVVFESHHPEKRWDGSVKGSESASKTDVYVWRLVTKNKYTGEEVEKEGHVTLIR
jgi:gliding motility-associated-like protein